MNSPWKPRIRALMLLLLAVSPQIGRTQVTVTYSYDNLQRVTGATSSDGSGVQYQYDANGNMLAKTLTNPAAASIGESLDVNLSAPGRSATLSFSASAGQSITINANSISMTPSGTSATLVVYNSSGAQVGSTFGTTNATLTLSNLAAGTYTIVVSPQPGATGVLQLGLANQSLASQGADAPLPLWAYLVLGLGLIGIAYRAHTPQTTSPGRGRHSLWG